MDERIYKKYYIGKARPGHWVSVYAYKPHNHEIRVKRGEIFAVISLIGPETFAVSTAGNLILDNLHENYFENQNDSALISLEKAVKGASNYLQKLLENDSAADVGINFDISAIAILGDLVYFVTLGNNVTKIWRDGKLTEVENILKDPTGEGIIRVGSMIGKSGDILFLTTEQFEKEVEEDGYIKLARTFSDIPLRERIFEDESTVAMLMLGYNLDFDALKAPPEIRLEKFEKSKKEINPKDAEEEDDHDDDDKDETLEELEKDEIDVIVDETPPEVEEHEETDDDDFIGQVEDSPIIPSVPVKKKSLPDFKKIKSKLPKIGAFFSSIIKKPKTDVYKYKEEDEEITKKNDLPEIHEEEPEEDKITPQEKIVNKSYEDKPTIVYYFSKAGSKIKNFGRLVWEDWLGMGKGSSNLKGMNKNRRWGFLVIVLIVVGGMIYFSVQDALTAQRKKAEELNAQRYINQAASELDSLEADAKIIAKSDINTERKDAFLAELADAEAILDNARNTESVAALVQVQDERIQYIEDLINKVIGVNDPTLLVDMGAKNPGSTLSDIAINITGRTIFYADSKYGKVYSLSYDGKTETELATGLNNPSTIAVDVSGNVLFMDDSTDRRLGIINPTDKTIQRVAGTSEVKLGGVNQIDFVLMSSSGSTVRVYALDPVGKAIYYLESSDGSGYGLPTKKNITLEELSSAKDIAIMDLKIYLLLNYNQGIYRSSSDKNDTPVVNGLSSQDDLTKATAFFIDDQYLYIADSTTKSIYVLTKNSMTFKAKFTYRGTENYFANFKDLVADRTSGKIFVLDGSRVFMLPMDGLANF